MEQDCYSSLLWAAASIRGIQKPGEEPGEEPGDEPREEHGEEPSEEPGEGCGGGEAYHQNRKT